MISINERLSRMAGIVANANLLDVLLSGYFYSNLNKERLANNLILTGLNKSLDVLVENNITNFISSKVSQCVVSGCKVAGMMITGVVKFE